MAICVPQPTRPSCLLHPFAHVSMFGMHNQLLYNSDRLQGFHFFRQTSPQTIPTLEDDDLLDEVLKEIAAALLHADVNVRYVSELRTTKPAKQA